MSDPISMTFVSHKGDVLLVFSKPVTKLGFTVDEAEKFLEGLATTIKQAREDLGSSAPNPGRRPS